MENITFLKSKKSISEFCKSNDIVFLALFGSYSKGEETFNSDIDLLYEIKKGKTKTLFDIGKMQYDLQNLLNKPVDFVENGYLKPEFEVEISKSLITIYDER